MIRELKEVRLYWPKAKVRSQLVDLDSGVVLWTTYSQDRHERLRITVYKDGTATVGGRVLPLKDQPSIEKAMHVAGFSERPLGKYKYYVKNVRIVVLHRANGEFFMLEQYWQTLLADNQRPRKGVRLGARKKMAAVGRSVSQWCQHSVNRTLDVMAFDIMASNTL